MRGQILPPSLQRKREPVALYPVEIAPFAGVRLAAIEHRGDYQKVGHTFDRVYTWAATRGLLGKGTRTIGVYYDDPQTIAEKELRADAGIIVADGAALEGEIRAVEIPPMLCASVLHKGPYAELETPYRYLFRDWLPQSGREAADFPCFEEYLNNPRELPASEWLTRIYLPIKE